MHMPMSYICLMIYAYVRLPVELSYTQTFSIRHMLIFSWTFTEKKFLAHRDLSKNISVQS